MTTKRVLVAYGSKHGSTAGIADEIGRTLRDDGFDTDVRPADTVTDVRDYDGVVLGGALYAGHWNGEARRCARRNAEQLRHRPVWLFSSGPVDSSAEQRDIPPVRGVARRMKQLGAREHVTFGGALTADNPDLVARAMVRHGKGGDFRDPARIRAWAHRIGDALGETG
ncbi:MULTISPECIES: flavodoxin domain-containing protein [Streptomyces]|uniref:flavodoxin domain-containing protein n=1 Tax=Streptomyces TaxID=1883 RepID=UPI0005B92C1F|nr:MULTISPECIES: flavodoxin domain-containing protein [unclassified Streptomyces]MCM1944659.1 flavodoxin domain-containing protein [Streptomyces sp. G2]